MSGMTIRSRFTVTARGFRILKKYCPGLVQGKALYELINSLQPFVTVWLSARIINELSAQQGIQKIVIYVISIILINFICSVVKTASSVFVMKKKHRCGSGLVKFFPISRCRWILKIWKTRKFSIKNRKQKKIFICLEMV